MNVPLTTDDSPAGAEEDMGSSANRCRSSSPSVSRISLTTSGLGDSPAGMSCGSSPLPTPMPNTSAVLVPRISCGLVMLDLATGHPQSQLQETQLDGDPGHLDATVSGTVCLGECPLGVAKSCVGSTVLGSSSDGNSCATLCSPGQRTCSPKEAAFDADRVRLGSLTDDANISLGKTALERTVAIVLALDSDKFSLTPSPQVARLVKPLQEHSKALQQPQILSARPVPELRYSNVPLGFFLAAWASLTRARKFNHTVRSRSLGERSGLDLHIAPIKTARGHWAHHLGAESSSGGANCKASKENNRTFQEVESPPKDRTRETGEFLTALDSLYEWSASEISSPLVSPSQGSVQRFNSEHGSSSALRTCSVVEVAARSKQSQRACSPVAPPALGLPWSLDAVLQMGGCNARHRRSLPAMLSSLAICDGGTPPTKDGCCKGLHRLESRVAPCWTDLAGCMAGGVPADHSSPPLSPLVPSPSSRRLPRPSGDTPSSPSSLFSLLSPDETQDSSSQMSQLDALRHNAAMLSQRLLRRERQCLALRNALQCCSPTCVGGTSVDGSALRCADGCGDDVHSIGESGADCRGGARDCENAHVQGVTKAGTLAQVRVPLASCENVR